MKRYEIIKAFRYLRLNKLFKDGEIIEMYCREAEKYKKYLKEVKDKLTKPYDKYITK